MKFIIFQQPSESVKNKILYNHRGQTLVMLLIFIIVAITIATTSVSLIIANAQVTSGTAQSMEAYYAAEAGVENATLQLLRNTNYTGETLQVSEAVTAEINVSHNGNYVVISKGKSGTFERVIQVNLDYTNNVLSINSWEEL